MLFLLLRMRRAAAWKFRRSVSWACGLSRLWTVAVVIPTLLTLQRRWVAGNEPFASFCVRRHGDGRTHAKAVKHPLSYSPIKIDSQTKKAREGAPQDRICPT